MTAWTDQYFGSLYGEIYRKHLMPAARAREEVQFVAERLQLRNQRVLDLAAGYGRHARLLARTARVVALDRSAEYLNQAMAGMRGKAAANLSAARADMRSLPFADGSFDSVLLLFNSFGYFVDAPGRTAPSAAPQGQVWKLPQVFYERQLVDQDFGRLQSSHPELPASNPQPGDDENVSVLREIARVLRPGGQLMLEAPNPKALVAAVQEHPRRHVITGSYEIEEEYHWDPDRNVLTNRTRFRIRQREQSAQYQLRLYKPSDLRKMLSSAGLAVLSTYGDYHGAAFRSAQSEMQLVHCSRR